MSMRKQFVTTIEKLMAKDDRLILLLGDIGVYSFRQAFENYPNRVYNIGILEQSTISLAAGLAKSGFIPIIHTIAPFLVERSYEQLKVDFGYQKLGGNFVSVGASYDYSALGCTHHCPADVGILKNIPGIEIMVPGTDDEFDQLFSQAYNDGNPTYYRLSERENQQSFKVKLGKANMVKIGKRATVVVVGPMLNLVLAACEGLDVTVLYYTTVFPFDSKTLLKTSTNNKVILFEPYYSGVLTTDICQSFYPKPVAIDQVGVPHEFLTNYGKAGDQDMFIGFSEEKFRRRIKRLIER